MAAAWDRLLPKLRELADLYGIAGLLEWDQAVWMPPAGGPARARASATLQGIAHRRLSDPEIGDLLDELEAADDLDGDQAASVRVLRRDYDRATKLPPDLVRELAACRGHAYQAWTRARPAADFGLLEPHLTRMLALKKDEADAVGYDGERYDALLDVFEPGMTTGEVEAMFTDLVGGLQPLVDVIVDAAGPAPDVLGHDFDTEQQKRFCNWLVETLGFDAQAGRVDLSPHPFSIRIGRGDVRQTTRTERRSILNPIYAAIHETGHALYEQGIPDEITDLPVGRPPSLGMHESQSRLWENQVGRSRAFTDFLLPHLKERFPQLGMVTRDDFYRAVNHPRRSPIRIYADEVTYNLHVAVRFELEVALLRDELEAEDLPDAWGDQMSDKLGIRPKDAAEGVLQDMHWSIGALGYFPTYTLGTLYAAAFYARAQAEVLDLEDDIRAGRFDRLLEWLRANVHSSGFRLLAKDLGHKVLGEPLTPRPFLDYIEHKYSEIYSLSV